MSMAEESRPRPGEEPADTVLRLMFTAVRTEPSEAAAAVLDTATTVEDETVDGVRITHHVWEGGRPRVLLVHGWSSHAGHMSALAAALSAAGLTVVVPDMPGHGRSADGDASVVHFANVIEHAERRYGPFDALVAHSLGAAAAVLALGRGVACQAAVFVNPMTSYESLWARNIAVFGVPPEVMAESVRRAEKWLNVSFDEIAPPVLARELRTRLLLVHDRLDKESALADSAVLVDAWPDARLVEVEGMGHTRVMTDPDIVAMVIDFIRAGGAADR